MTEIKLIRASLRNPERETMCLARPVRVIRREREWVEVEGTEPGCTHRVWAELLAESGLEPGDYLLVHGEIAIHRLPEDEALKIIEIVETL